MDILKLGHHDWVSFLNEGNVNPKKLIHSAIEGGLEFNWHPLGFAICKLISDHGKCIRLHIWPNNLKYIQSPAWLIHDHLFDLNSWVINGKIKNTEYKEYKEEPNHCFYNVNYQSDKSLLSKTDIQIRLEELSVNQFEENSKYSVKAGILHQSQSIFDGVSVTVCETINRITRAPRVVGDIKGDHLYSYIRRKITDSELIELHKKI